MNDKEFLWVERYRPKSVEETILPKQLKATFQQFVDQGEIPNLILSGSAGIGKTTIARSMLEQLGCDYIIINGSMSGNIDTLRNEILNFASTVSLQGGRKYVILDEADYLNANSTQPALRNFMEEFSKNCCFILTCNLLNRIIDPLHSRCSVIEFKIPKAELPKLASQFHKRVCSILEKENIEYDAAVVAEVIKKHYPDWRRIIGQLQTYSATGRIDSGLLINLEEVSLKALITNIKEKDFTAARKWISENLDNNSSEIFNKFYSSAQDYVKPQFVPALVLLIGKYQYQSAFAVDAEINLAAFVAEVMVEGIFN